MNRSMRGGLALVAAPVLLVAACGTHQRGTDAPDSSVIAPPPTTATAMPGPGPSQTTKGGKLATPPAVSGPLGLPSENPGDAPGDSRSGG